MNIFDIAIIVVLIMFAIVGLKHGVIKKAVSLVGLIAIFIVAFTCKEEIGNVLCKYLPFIEFGGNLEGLISLNILFYQLIGFILIYSLLFVIYQAIVKMSEGIQKIINATIILALPSKLAGFILGIIEGYIIIFAVLLVVLVPFKDNKIISDSKLVNIIVDKTPILSSYTSDISATIDDIYNLVDDLTNAKLTANQANLEIIDTMIEYDIVSKKTIEQLIVLDKLNDIEGLDKILDKYER